MDIDMDQIWKTIFSKEAIGIIVILIGAYLVLKVLKKINKAVLAAMVIGALVAVGYIFFPGLLDAAVTWFKGGWMDS